MSQNALIYVLNGPNLNMLGHREPEIYGTQTLFDIQKLCEQFGEDHDFTLRFYQSNHEGQLIEWCHEAHEDQADGLIINAAGYTHSSVALHDALRLCECPIIEIHLTNLWRREAFRHTSLVSPVACGIISGFGSQSYILALRAMKELLITGRRYAD